jgi:predicted ABC-type sugar transport system permease subunit
MTNQTTQDVEQQDAQYLKLLSIFHYIVGGLAGLFACFPLFHFGAGIFLVGSSLTGAMAEEEALPMLFVGLLFTLIAGGIILLGWATAIAIMAAGYFLAHRKRYLFCLVVAGVECIFMPFGTVLGIFTIIVLVRPSVTALFQANAQAEA